MRVTGNRWARIFLLAAAYAASGKLGLLLAIPPGFATAIWPPSGIALAALFLGGRRLWPGVWLGSFTVNFLTSYNPGDPGSLPRSLALAASLGAGAALQAVAGATLVRLFVRSRNPLDEERDILALLLWGGPASCLVAATWGVTSLWLAGAVNAGAFLFNWWTWWVGDTIGVLIMAPLILLWARPSLEWRRRLSVTFPMVLTFALAVALFIYASRVEERAARTAFEDQAESLADSLQRLCASHVEILRSVTALLFTVPEIRRASFESFVSGILERQPVIQAYSWNPLVRRDDREAFEAAARQEGYKDFRIVERLPDGRLIPAARRPEHVAVLYVEPFAPNRWALGFDVASEQTRREALQRARDRGETTATAAIRLVQVPGQATHSSSILIFTPVYRGGGVPPTVAQRRRDLRGYATGVLRLGKLMEQTTREQLREGLTHALLDLDASPDRRLLHASADWKLRAAGDKGLEWDRSFSVAGRRWSLRIAATPAYMAAHRSWRAWMVLAAGLLFTSLLQAFLLVLTSRAAKVENLVKRRTAELHQELAERRRAESVLRVNETRHRALLDHMLAALVTADFAGRIESLNPAAERMFGYQEEELRGRSVAALLADAPATDPEPFLQQAYRKSLGRVTEWWGRRKNGEVFPFEIALFDFDTPEGRRVAGNILDISERREVERLKSEFVATVSHELRTPLTSIRGSLGLLAAGAAGVLPSRAQEMVRLAERNSVRLAVLINDILDFERLESGKAIFSLHPVPLDQLVAKALESVRDLADSRDVRVRVLSSPSLNVMADEARLFQVLMNLLSNAVKFSPSGREVLINAIPLEGRIRIQVIDQGRGIPASHRQRIFERFVQVEISDQIEKGGTGLGLAISKTIVERHGGLIGVESEPGKGSTFWVELPTVPAAGS